MAEGFGLGMGVMDMCGALSGAFMLAGVKGSAGIEAPGTTKGADLSSRPARWRTPSRRKNGTYLCCELKRASPTAMSAAPAPVASRMRARWSRRCSVCKKQEQAKIKPLYLFRYSGFSYVYSEHRSADQTGIIAERGQDQLGIRVAAEGLLLDAPAQRREQLSP